jgi:type IX secretion system PorP/SprF family membrane protein
MKKIYSTLAVLIIGINIFAQQIPNLGQYYSNPYLVNPSEIGRSDYTNLFVHYRNQWEGMPGAPVTKVFTADGPVKKEKIGLGFSFYQDETNIVSNSGGYLSYRYTMNVKEKHHFSFGISGGVLHNRIYFDRIRADVPDENTLLYNMESGAGFDANLGLTYQFKQLKVSLGGYQLLGSRIGYANPIDEKEITYSLVQHYSAGVQYRLSRNKLHVDPLVHIRSPQGMPLQLDAGTYINYNDNYWIGALYRSGYGISASFGGVFYDRLVLGYAYDINMGKMAAISGGTHEIVLGLRIQTGGGKTGTTKYDYDHKEFDKLKTLNQEQYEEIEKLRVENEIMKEKVEKTEQSVQAQKEEIERMNKIFENDKEAIEEVISKYQADIPGLGENTTEGLEEGSGEDFNPDNKYYVIVGAYLQIGDAKLFQKILEREIGLITNVKPKEGGKIFFVYSSIVKSNKEALAEYDRLYNLGIEKYKQGNLWIYSEK